MIQILNLLKSSSLCLLSVILSLALFEVQAGFYESHAKGWHWYEVNQEKDKEDNKESLSSLSPTEALEKIKQTIEEKKAKAILFPTEANLYEYIKIQEHWAAQAEKFANVWQRVIHKNPELNYGLKHPTSELAKKVEQLINTKETNKAIASIGKYYGLFYFYRASCPYCIKFSPILKTFADNHHLKILPISLDGSANSAFGTFKANNGIAEQWGVEHVPALYAVSPHKNEIIPITFGLVSQKELEQRFLMLANFLKEKRDVSMPFDAAIA